MRTLVIAALLLASAFAAEAKITLNGPAHTGAAVDRVVAVLSIALPGQRSQVIP